MSVSVDNGRHSSKVLHLLKTLETYDANTQMTVVIVEVIVAKIVLKLATPVCFLQSLMK